MGNVKEKFIAEVEKEVEGIMILFAKTPLCDVQGRVRQLVEAFVMQGLELKELQKSLKTLEVQIEALTPKTYNS